MWTLTLILGFALRKAINTHMYVYTWTGSATNIPDIRQRWLHWLILAGSSPLVPMYRWGLLIHIQSIFLSSGRLSLYPRHLTQHENLFRMAQMNSRRGPSPAIRSKKPYIFIEICRYFTPCRLDRVNNGLIVNKHLLQYGFEETHIWLMRDHSAGYSQFYYLQGSTRISFAVGTNRPIRCYLAANWSSIFQ